MAVTLPLLALFDGEARKLGEISGQNVHRCMQCGTCTAVCPMAEEMKITTRRAMLLLQHGMQDVVSESETPWLCASCHTCEVRCPRALEIPRVMEAVRQLTLRTNTDRINPRELPRDQVAALPQIAMVAAFRKLTA